MAPLSGVPSSLSNSIAKSEIAVIAAFRAGAAGLRADSEDIAVKANEIAPGRFTWKKYAEQINIGWRSTLSGWART